MWLCTRCQAEMDDAYRICRACGAIAPETGAAVAVEASVVEPAVEVLPEVTAEALPEATIEPEPLEEVLLTAAGVGEAVAVPRQPPEVLPVGAHEEPPPRRPKDWPCPECGGAMYRIRLIDTGHGGSHGDLQYAADDAERDWFFGRFPVEGQVRARMCPACGRIVLYGVETS